MNTRSVMLVAIALVVAGITALMARNLMSQQATPVVQAALPQAAPEGPKVLVAALPLQRGMLLEPEHLRWSEWPKDGIIEDYFLDDQFDATTLHGRVVRTSLLAGQPLTNAATVGPGERGFLAAVLNPGMRAITVSISDTSGVAGFVFPGDRVDLVLSHEVEKGEDKRIQISETVIENVRVLAVDQDTNDQLNQPQIRRTVTLEVTPKLVEKISVMQLIGSVSLSLRPLSEEALAASAGITDPALAGADPLQAAAGAGPALAGTAGAAAAAGAATASLTDAAGNPVEVSLPWANDPRAKGENYSVGADVSRFAEGARTPAAAPVRRYRASKPQNPSVIVTRGNEVSKESGAR